MHLLNNSAYYKNRSTSANILILPRRIITLNKEQFTSEICQSTFIPKDLLNDPNTFGLLFETMAVRDLRVYADSLGGDVYHFRDKEGLECDAVVHLRNGSYGLVEIKLGGDSLIKEGVSTLTELASRIDTEKMKKPSFLMVLTGIGEYPYRRAEDGVLVVPIGCLKD